MATELAKAYVQIVPSAQGITGKIGEALGNEPELAGQKAGQSLGSALIKKLGAVVAAAGIGKMFTSAISEGGSLQQSLGGVETLFKDSADAIKEYASQAYQTAGVSANSYMEQVTGFSATLIQGLEGDTERAVEVANRAMIDMADNANKFGTDIQLVQNAYQGFAKDNYDMLDNLKLGYGGTQAEMARLINDSGVLGGAIEVTADTVKDVPFDFIIEAIHQIQTDLGITGTTAQEASTTLQGSFASMQAAAQNILGNLALGEDVRASMEALVETTSTYLLDNLLPTVGNIAAGLPGALSEGVSSTAQVIAERGPEWLEAGTQMLESLKTGVAEGLPDFLASALPMVTDFTANLRTNFGQLVDSGIDLVLNLAQGLVQALPDLIAYVPQIVSNIAGLINDNAPKLLVAAGQLMLTLGKGLIENIPVIVSNLPQIFGAIVDVISAFNWLDLGKTIIDGILKGVPATFAKIGETFTNFAKDAAGIIRDYGWKDLGEMIVLFIADGVSSLPSIFFNLGKNLIQSIWNGIKSMKAFAISQISSLFGATTTAAEESAAAIAAQSALEWQAAEDMVVSNAEKNAFILEQNAKKASQAAEEVARGVDLSTAARIAEFAQKTAESGTEATKKAVEKQKTLLEQLQEAYQKAYAAPQLRQSIAQLEYDIWAKQAGEATTKAEDLAKQLESMGKQQAAQKEIVAAAQLAYDTYIASQDATEEGALELYKTLLEETDAYEALQDEIDAATDAMAEQQDAAKQLSGALGDVLSDLGDVGGGVSKLGSLLGSDFLSGVGGFISDIASGVTTIIGLSGSIEGLVASAGTLGETLGPLLSSVAGEGLGAIAAGLSSAAASLGPVLAAAGPWILGIGGVLGLGGLLVAGISKLFSSSQPTTPDLSGAVGGGYPSDSNSWGPHTVVEMGGVTIQLSGSYNDPELAAQQIAYHLGELVKQRTTVYG